MNWGNCFTCSVLSLSLQLLFLMLRRLWCTEYELTRVAGVNTGSKGDDNGVRSVGEVGENTVNQINQFKPQAYLTSLACITKCITQIMQLLFKNIVKETRTTQSRD